MYLTDEEYVADVERTTYQGHMPAQNKSVLRKWLRAQNRQHNADRCAFDWGNEK